MWPRAMLRIPIVTSKLGSAMTTPDLEILEAAILASLAAASDLERGLEQVRVAALGKKGIDLRVQLKGLGRHVAGRARKVTGARRVNGLKSTGLRSPFETCAARPWHSAALEARLASGNRRMSPCRCVPAPCPNPVAFTRSPRSSDEITAIFADMGFSHRRRAGYRDRLL